MLRSSHVLTPVSHICEAHSLSTFVRRNLFVEVRPSKLVRRSSSTAMCTSKFVETRSCRFVCRNLFLEKTNGTARRKARAEKRSGTGERNRGTEKKNRKDEENDERKNKRENINLLNKMDYLYLLSQRRRWNHVNIVQAQDWSICKI